MYFDTSLKTSRRDYSDLSSTGFLSDNGIFFQRGLFERGVKREMEGSDGTCEGSGDNTVLVQIEEAKCAIHNLPCMTVLARVRTVGDNGPGCQVSLSCSGLSANQ